MEAESKSSNRNIFVSPKFCMIYLCFFTFGALVPLTKPEPLASTFLISIFLSLLVGFSTVFSLTAVFKKLNPFLLNTNYFFAQEAVESGMLFVIPFTILAIVAKLALGWDAIMPFASSAVTTAMATAGTEVMKKGGQGSKNVLIPSALAFVISIVWMLVLGILP